MSRATTSAASESSKDAHRGSTGTGETPYGLNPSIAQHRSYAPLPYFTVPSLHKQAIFNMVPGLESYPLPPYEVLNPMMESCAFRTFMGTIAGYGMGVLFGLFMGALGGEMNQSYLFHPSGRDAPNAPLLEQMRISYRSVGSRSLAMGTSFATLTAVFSGAECLIEKYRGKHDIVNGALSGCAAGAALQAKAGPAAACMGCAGFAAFSVAIEAIMGPH